MEGAICLADLPPDAVLFDAHTHLGDDNIQDLLFGAGVNWAFWRELALTGEINGSTPFNSEAFHTDETPVGLLFGLRYAPEIRFEIDRTFDEADRIGALLRY